MKVIHSAITDGLSGTTGNSVLMRTRSPKFSYLRVWRQPARTEQNDYIGEVSKNLGSQVDIITPEGKEDLRLYAKKYKDIPYFGDKHKVRAGNWFAVWTLLIWNVAKEAGEEDNINGIEIKTLFSSHSIANVKNACDQGLLPKVDGYEEMTNDFFTI